MPPRRLKKKSVKRLVEKRVAKAIEEYKKSRANLDSARSSGGNTGNAKGTVNVHGCSHKTFMNGKPHSFNGTDGVVGLRRWIEKVEQVFKICKCAEEDKVMFAASTFEGRALIWWNGNVHTLGLANANHISWTEFKTMMTTEYCPATEIQKMEQELWTLTLKGDDMEAYSNRFHALETARAYVVAPAEGRGYAGNLPRCNHCNSHHNEQCPPKCQKCQRTGHQEKDCRVRVSGAGVIPLQDVTCYGCGEKGHYKDKCPKGRNQQNEGARARAYVVVENLQHNPNMVTGMFLLNDHYDCILFDSGAEKSFVSYAFTPFIDIAPAALNTSYEVELADGKVVGTNTILRGCTLALYNHCYQIDLLLTRLGSFDVIVGMDWLLYHRTVIDCYEKIVRIPLPNGEILEVQGERFTSCARDRISHRSDPRRVASCEIAIPISSIRDVRVVEPAKGASRKGLYSTKSLIIGSTQEEHEVHLKRILDLIKKEKLYAKFSKCEFWLKEVQFLGQVVNRDSIHVDPTKVESVKNWKTPESSTKIYSFLGLAGYYRRRWIELLSVYECEIKYHPGKANVVADALSRKERLKPRRVRAMGITIHSGLKTKILEAQGEASKDLKALAEWLRGLETHFKRRDDGGIYFFDRIWIPSVGGVRKLIMDEAHTSRYLLHPGTDKMYYDLKDLYWWPGIKRDIAEYVSRCLTCSKVKAEHQNPSGLLQQPEIPEWKWEKITMDLVTYFLEAAVGGVEYKTTYEYGLPPETDGQSEHTIQTLEDMLRACVVDFGGSWDTHLPLVEFSYNNSYHTSIKCAPFRALYGQKCRSPVIWTEVGESQLIGPEIVQETTKKIIHIKERLKTARSHQKSYADKRRKPLELKVGDRVLLKVSPWKGVVRFGKKGKLSPRSVEPFEIAECVGSVAYRLKLPRELSCIHDTFYVSNLKKCLAESDVSVRTNFKGSIRISCLNPYLRQVSRLEAWGQGSSNERRL
nr:retrotransposon protein, putative, Ty3-gypsy subclass [Tanacetum cinerariifolium]